MSKSEANKQLVLDFCKTWHTAWAAQDLSSLMDYFTDDIVWQDIPDHTRVGKQECIDTTVPFFEMCDEVEFDVKNILAGDRIVMTERVDTMVMKDGRRASTPIMGVFEIENGKIKVWRDYFDLDMFKSQLEVESAEAATA